VHSSTSFVETSLVYSFWNYLPLPLFPLQQIGLSVLLIVCRTSYSTGQASIIQYIIFNLRCYIKTISVYVSILNTTSPFLYPLVLISSPASTYSFALAKFAISSLSLHFPILLTSFKALLPPSACSVSAFSTGLFTGSSFL